MYTKRKVNKVLLKKYVEGRNKVKWNPIENLYANAEKEQVYIDAERRVEQKTVIEELYNEQN